MGHCDIVPGMGRLEGGYGLIKTSYKHYQFSHIVLTNLSPCLVTGECVKNK